MAVITSIDCVLPRPDIAALHQQVATELSKRLLGGAPVLPMSTEDVLSFVMAGTVNLMFGAVTQALKENDPATMCCDNLVAYGAKHGIDLRGATRSKGYVGITGIPNSPITSTIRFVGESSREYKPDPGVTTNPVTLDATGAASLRVVAVTAGSEFDLPAGSPLVVSTTIPGIDIDATVIASGLKGGTSDETCESLRARIVEAEALGAMVTNDKWYLQETMAYPGITRACTNTCCIDPNYDIVVYPFMEGAFGDAMTAPYGVPPVEVLAEMTEWMFGKVPGLGEGVAPIGTRGRYETAYPTILNVSAQCFSGCPEGAEDRISAALWSFIRCQYCTGSTICKVQLHAVITNALGVDNCVSAITLAFDGTLALEDDANAYLACEHFLVLGSVVLNPISPIPRK